MSRAPRYPIYVISKGRAESRLTVRTLQEISAPFRVVIEPQEFDQYATHIPQDQILTLPFSNLGQGSIPARNWVWGHASSEGHRRHWILDDNIRHFFRFNHRKRTRMEDCDFFGAMEDFVDSYANVALAGPQYQMFGCTTLTKAYRKPAIFNTRIYSCILILNSLPFRWRGRYNEDTDLSLRALKAGWCTIQFLAFLSGKQATMTMRGGNTDELYRQDEAFDGRLEMARSLYRQHPDVVKITRKWGRWQHHVDYRPFEGNRLIRANWRDAL